MNVDENVPDEFMITDIMITDSKAPKHRTNVSAGFSNDFMAGMVSQKDSPAKETPIKKDGLGSLFNVGDGTKPKFSIASTLIKATGLNLKKGLFRKGIAMDKPKKLLKCYDSCRLAKDKTTVKVLETLFEE